MDINVSEIKRSLNVPTLRKDVNFLHSDEMSEADIIKLSAVTRGENVPGFSKAIHYAHSRKNVNFLHSAFCVFIFRPK